MPKRNFVSLEEFNANIHKEGATLIEFSGRKVPCILIRQKKYHDILSKTYGRPVRADTLLDIFYDGRDVFVDIQIKFIGTDFEENFLFYANGMLEFFAALAESGLMALGPDLPSYTNSQNVFMIQLPRKDAAEQALYIIKTNVKKQAD